MGGEVVAAIITAAAAAVASNQQTQAAKAVRHDARRAAERAQAAESRRERLAELAMTNALQRRRLQATSGRQSQILVSPLGGSGGSQGGTGTLIGS